MKYKAVGLKKRSEKPLKRTCVSAADLRCRKVQVRSWNRNRKQRHRSRGTRYVHGSQKGPDSGDTDISSGSSTSSIDSRTSKMTQVPHDTSKSNFLVEMERLRQGTKMIRKDTRPGGVGNDGNKDTGSSGVRTRSKKD
ncbi:hypothetical protein NDU88_003189 [Pleurodeles waltl]|uniref:Uncharacterized protein n=1 Tax=Pleurodeles waltl TaxID=8319 RepID=A0AAV7P9C1_PLEWA|nr:hypothetical protein NDU88_003189 [Pleurodeles waltl]